MRGVSHIGLEMKTSKSEGHPGHAHLFLGDFSDSSIKDEFEEEKREWNHFQDNLWDLEGERQMGKEKEDQWEWETGDEIPLRSE